jgi:CDP-glycerol glycerophosphotransferase (TagB/SpsB family)
VHVGHGLLSKGQYYTNTPIARREQDADLVCVPGKHHQHVLRQIISKPVIATGMAKLDPLFSGKTTRSSVLRKYGLPENYKYVLFAPTFNDELSAIPYVLENIAQVLPDSKTILLIKLHGSTKTEYKQRYQRLPTKDKRVVYIDELNITPFLALADVMVSDVSSAMFEFAALDKPVVLFDSPDWSKYVNYNPGDIEFTWRNFALRAGNLEELKIGVKRSLDYPDEYSGLRRQYTKKLLANHKDGNAAERIVKSAYSIIGKTLQISYLDQAHIKNEANI